MDDIRGCTPCDHTTDLNALVNEGVRFTFLMGDTHGRGRVISDHDSLRDYLREYVGRFADHLREGSSLTEGQRDEVRDTFVRDSWHQALVQHAPAFFAALAKAPLRVGVEVVHLMTRPLVMAGYKGLVSEARDYMPRAAAVAVLAAENPVDHFLSPDTPQALFYSRLSDAAKYLLHHLRPAEEKPRYSRENFERRWLTLANELIKTAERELKPAPLPVIPLILIARQAAAPSPQVISRRNSPKRSVPPIRQVTRRGQAMASTHRQSERPISEDGGGPTIRARGGSGRPATDDEGFYDAEPEPEQRHPPPPRQRRRVPAKPRVQEEEEEEEEEEEAPQPRQPSRRGVTGRPLCRLLP